jgi:midasin (ATPase involved in ribosome maturation)
LQTQQQNEIGKRRRKRSPNKEAKDDALDLAEDLNLNKVGRDHSSDSDLLDSDRSEVSDDRDLTASQLARKRKR